MSDGEIKVRVKAGPVTTIANSVYSSTLMKIREALSNSYDNKADRSSFFLKNDDQVMRLSILDNGDGISKKRFFEIFTSIGCGLEKTQEDAFSYFGLGLMSIFKLGKQVTIISKTLGDGIKKVVVDSYQFFHEDNQNKDISELEEFISISNSSCEERNEVSPLSEEAFIAVLDSNLEKFTEIIVDDLYPEDVTEITSPGFVDEVRKIAPLPVSEDDVFFDYVKDDDKEAILELLSNEEYFPTITYFFGIQEEDKIDQLYKYFPCFSIGNNKLELYKCDVYDDYAMYVLYSIGDLQPNDDIKESGFWIRNKNFLVKGPDLLMYPGANRIIHKPLAPWIFAEISHENMNQFLEVTRNQFVIRSAGFKDFRRSIEAQLSPLNSRLRKIYDYGVERIKLISEPF